MKGGGDIFCIPLPMQLTYGTQERMQNFMLSLMFVQLSPSSFVCIGSCHIMVATESVSEL